MQRAVIPIRAVLGRIMFIGLSIQIVLGLFWMCCSFTGVQNVPVCLLQLAVASLTGYFFLAAAGVRNSSLRIWGSLVLLTYPMAMQCHMAVLPNSLTFSLFLLQITFVLRMVKRMVATEVTEGKGGVWDLLGMHLSWFGAALLTPDYLYLGMVPMAVFLIYDAVKNRKKAGRRVCCRLLLSVVFIGMIVTTQNLSSQAGYYGRSTKSLESVLFQRVCWSSLPKYYLDWPQDVLSSFSDETFYQAAAFPEKMNSLLLPEIEEALGEEAAKENYLRISKYVLKNNYYQIIYEVLWDGLGNLFPLPVADMTLDGRGYTSYCARNYETMRQECPLLTKYYMQYCTWWFGIGMVLAAGMQILGFFQRHKSCLFPVVVCVLSAGAMAVWYTISGAGVWDYKNGLFTGALWIVWMIIMAVKGVEEEL